MLFPAGQAVSRFLYNTATKMDTNNINAATIIAVLTDYRLVADSVEAGVRCVMRFPGLYKTWWWNLVTKDPLHVAIETIMLISIVYMMLSRSTEGYKDSSKDKLSPREQEDLLWEWKHQTREPLAPVRGVEKKDKKEESANNDSDNTGKSGIGVDTEDYDDDNFQIVVQKQEGIWLTITVPCHWITNQSNTNGESSAIETNNTSDKASNGSSNGKTDKKNSNDAASLSPPSQRREVELRVLNFANFDFLGFQTSDALREASTDALNKYGCGSCGPRGFYGTIDAHLQLEEEMSRFCRTDQAILYSDGASTCSSTVAAFAKRGDLLVVDEGVYEPLSTGVYLSRANVHWFRHNDVQDLERVLKELQDTDKKLGRKPGAQRRFIVVEGLYKNMGTIAPLDEIVALKHKYKYRLILDESFSFGTLGKTGRGALEEHNKRPMYDAEITTIALENSIGSIGGVTVGNEEVVDHQRLSGAGYCFSASAPPFTASAAVASLRIIEDRPDLVQRLQSNVRYTYKRLLEKVEEYNSNETKNCYKLVVTSDSRSPIVVLQLEEESVYESTIMTGIMRACLQRGLGIVASINPPESQSGNGNTIRSNASCTTELAPCIRMTVSALHTKEDTDMAIGILTESVVSVTSRYPVDAATT